jgi:hypothetical protein
MSNSSNELTLALLATLEAQARKHGKKSVAKRVASHLRKIGADNDLVSQVEALGGGKPPATAPRKRDHQPTPKAKAKSADGALPAA